MNFRPQERMLALAITLALIGAACLLSFKLQALIPDGFILFFLAASGISGWFGKEHYGTLAASLSVIGVYYFLTRAHAFLPSRGQLLYLLLFIVCSFSASWLSAQRRRHEDDLAAREHRLRLLVEGIKDYAIFLLDSHGYVASWSASAERILGYADREVVGRHFSTFYLPDDVARGHPETELKIAARDGRYEEEGLRIRKDGSRFWANVILTPLFDRFGRLTGFSKVTRDITERKRAEEQLERSRGELRSVIEAAPDAVLVADETGTIIFMNGQTERLFGYSRGELLGQYVEQLIPERIRKNHPEHRANYWRAPHARPMGKQLELYGLRKDGTEFPVEISLSPVDATEGRRVIAAIRDVTERKLTEQALQQTRILDLAQAIIRDLDGRVRHWSVGVERLYGIPRDEALGRISHELLATTFPEPLAQIEAKVLADGQWEGELEHKTRSGHNIIVRSYWALYRDERGAPSQVLEMNTDITDRIHSERALEAMNQRLERQNIALQNAKLTIENQTQQIATSAKMSALGEMAGGIAHEINNPMGIIHARASDLGETAEECDSIPSAVVKQTTDKICQMAMRVSAITRGLRKFARDSRSDPFHSSSIAEVLEDTLVLCQERLRQRSIEFRLPSNHSHLRIDCRPTEIAQVLLNLLNNAFDAVQPLPEKWIAIEILDLGDAVEIAVTDSGQGIPPELREKLDQPFFTTKEIGRGTGLGLSISRGIVEAHQGQLSLDTASPNTRFVVRLPKHQPVESARVAIPQ